MVAQKKNERMSVSAWVMSGCMSYKSMRIYECMSVCMYEDMSVWASMRMGGMHGCTRMLLRTCQWRVVLAQKKNEHMGV